MLDLFKNLKIIWFIELRPHSGARKRECTNFFASVNHHLSALNGLTFTVEAVLAALVRVRSQWLACGVF